MSAYSWIGNFLSRRNEGYSIRLFRRGDRCLSVSSLPRSRFTSLGMVWKWLICRSERTQGTSSEPFQKLEYRSAVLCCLPFPLETGQNPLIGVSCHLVSVDTGDEQIFCPLPFVFLRVPIKLVFSPFHNERIYFPSNPRLMKEVEEIFFSFFSLSSNYNHDCILQNQHRRQRRKTELRNLSIPDSIEWRKFLSLSLAPCVCVCRWRRCEEKICSALITGGRENRKNDYNKLINSGESLLDILRRVFSLSLLLFSLSNDRDYEEKQGDKKTARTIAWPWNKKEAKRCSAKQIK